MESRRQSKVGKLIQTTFGEILQRYGREIYGNAMVSVTYVNMTPDLGVARINLSIYNTDEKEEVLKMIELNSNELRKRLGNKIRNNFRRVPELQFFMDSTLDKVFRIDEILRNDGFSSKNQEEE